MTQKLDEFQDNIRDVDTSIQKTEERLAAHNKQGTTSRHPKHADKIMVSTRAIQEQLAI